MENKTRLTKKKIISNILLLCETKKKKKRFPYQKIAGKTSNFSSFRLVLSKGAYILYEDTNIPHRMAARSSFTTFLCIILYCIVYIANILYVWHLLNIKMSFSSCKL